MAWVLSCAKAVDTGALDCLAFAGFNKTVPMQ